jgi:phosphatidate cytidylyltransferase
MTEAMEYQSRLWVGFALAGAVLLILFLDPVPVYPGLFGLFLVLAVMTLAELYHLLAALPRQPYALLVGGITLIHAANWLPHIWPLLGTNLPQPDPMPTLLGALVLVFVAAFGWEMATYKGEPNGAIVRVALTSWMVLYLGLLPSFLVQMRWLWTDPTAWFNWKGAFVVALAVFLPKVGDIGAYFAGKRLGRHRMTPVLSPKKTWEGLIGGLLASTLAAVAVQMVYPLFTALWMAVGFGLTVGLAGVLGDLAESLIKRDAGQKDASTVVPGFGGLLDVIDSVLFAAPVAYCWLR